MRTCIRENGQETETNGGRDQLQWRLASERTGKKRGGRERDQGYLIDLPLLCCHSAPCQNRTPPDQYGRDNVVSLYFIDSYKLYKVFSVIPQILNVQSYNRLQIFNTLKPVGIHYITYLVSSTYELMSWCTRPQRI